MAGILELSDQKRKTPMSNVLRAVMNKVDSVEEQMSNPQKAKPRKGRLNKTEQSIQGLRDNYKKCNVCTIGRRGEKGTEDIFGIIMTRHLPRLM